MKHITTIYLTIETIALIITGPFMLLSMYVVSFFHTALTEPERLKEFRNFVKSHHHEFIDVIATTFQVFKRLSEVDVNQA